MTTVLPVAEYTPDMPSPLGQGSDNILNVYPRTKLSYGPINSPVATGYGALNSRCQGAASFIKNDGTIYSFAGSGTDLYYLTSGLNAWTNVSKSAGAYSIGSDQQWQFTYLNGKVIAVNISNPSQVFTPGTSTTFTDLSSAAPYARYIGVVKNAFVMMGHTYDPTNGLLPQRLWWSGAGVADSWPTPGGVAAAQVQSGAADLLGPSGWVMGLATDLLNADAAVFQQYSVRRLMYVGPPDIFTALPVENARGTAAPYSIVTYGGVAYYLAQDGFAAFDGGSVRTIGNDRVDKTFFSLLDATYISRVVGTADLLNKLIFWAFPGPQNNNGNPNYLLCYNTEIDRWSLVQVTCETLVKMLGIGYTLDQLYTLLGYTLDTLPAPLDSLIWQGGQLQLGIFDTNHKLSLFTGQPLAATVETNESQPFNGKFAAIGRLGARPFIDGTSTPSPTVAIGHRNRTQDDITYTSDVALNSLGFSPLRASGRYIRASTKIPAPSAGQTATWTNISGIEVDLVQQGDR